MAYLTDEERLKKEHIVLMRHTETALYSGVIMMGESSISDEGFTAYTDGVNKKYGRGFMQKQRDDELRGLILHENLHVTLMHIPRHKDLMRESPILANIAMDLVVNDIIVNLEDKALCKLPEGGVYDPKYHGWSVREIYNELKKENPQLTQEQQQLASGGGGSGSREVVINGKKVTVQGDEHDGQASPKSAEEMKQLEEQVNRAIREGGMLAGRLGAKVPRTVEQSLEAPVDWKAVLRDFITASVRGRDELSWRRFNRSMLANGILSPSVESETMTEVVVAIDTSGSIDQAMISAFASQLQAICDSCCPEKVRVLWWDTHVHGEQVFDGTSQGIARMLKPMGGGGTRVSCVSEYIVKNRLSPDCVLVFTDGYLEDNIEWNTSSETLWLIKGNERFSPPKGKKVMVN